MTIEAHGETLIHRSVEDVFDYLSDPRNEPRWLPGAKSVTMTSDGEVGLGSTFVGEYARAVGPSLSWSNSSDRHV